MGNRGVLHNAQEQIVRTSAVKRWIACRTAFRGRRVPLMEPNRYTPLFFLDEATALAAGHRPCAECRNADYKRFRECWEAEYGTIESSDSLDSVLHAERLDGKRKRTRRSDLATLPDGTYVAIDDVSRVVWGTELVEWTDSGYRDRIARPHHAAVDVLTPPSIVAAIRADYQPEVHPTLLFGSNTRAKSRAARAT